MSRRNAPNKAPPSSAADFPAVAIANRQRKLPLDLSRIRRLVARALPLCLAQPGPLTQRLSDLPAIVASIISPGEMGRVHLDFLAIEGPTDVITFPDGEILVCAAVAAENAARYGNSLDDEVVLYIIHGLLHLHGFDDLETHSARHMRARQAKILNAARKTA